MNCLLKCTNINFKFVSPFAISACVQAFFRRLAEIRHAKNISEQIGSAWHVIVVDKVSIDELKYLIKDNFKVKENINNN